MLRLVTAGIAGLLLLNSCGSVRVCGADRGRITNNTLMIYSPRVEYKSALCDLQREQARAERHRTTVSHSAGRFNSVSVKMHNISYSRTFSIVVLKDDEIISRGVVSALTNTTTSWTGFGVALIDTVYSPPFTVEVIGHSGKLVAVIE